MGLPLLGGLQLAGSIFGGLFGASAAKKAAQQQIAFQQKGIDTISGNLDKSLGAENEFYNKAAVGLDPYTAGGRGAEFTLSDLTKTPGQGLLTPFSEQFRTPTGSDLLANPMFQALQETGTRQIQNSAAARGNLLSGSTLADLSRFNTGLSGQFYNDMFNQALQGYQTRYNVFAGNQANQFNRLAQLSGMGQQAAETGGQFALGTGSNIAGLYTGAGANIAGIYGGMGATRAAGTVGAANALTGGVRAGLSDLSQLMLLNKILPGGGGGGGGYGAAPSFGQDVQT